MKKKFVATGSLLLAMCFSLCACGETTPTPGGGDDPDPTPNDEYTLPLEDGKNQVTVYYSRAAGYSDSDFYTWNDQSDAVAYTWHECDFGGKVVFNLAEDITEIGFIVRVNCTDPGSSSWNGSKDGTDLDRTIKITDRETVIYLKAGDEKSYSSEDGGKTLKVIYELTADMSTLKTMYYTLNVSLNLTKEDLSVKDEDGNEVPIKSYTAATKKIILDEPIDITKTYYLHMAGVETPAVVTTNGYYSNAAFGELYNYDGELGVELSANQTIFRLWAPTASSVKLNLFDAGDGGTAYKTVDLTPGEQGLWTYTENAGLNGKYYTYTVKTNAGAQEAVDPYAVSAGLNGKRGMILDLDLTDPTGWENDTYINNTENYTDAEIWEVHVRDFSIALTSSQHPGKYLAFTEAGLTVNGQPAGLDYLKNLGITHVHLNPVYDFGSVDESTDTGYNWGYDPQNYNVPEGSYSTDATKGEVRVKEFKQMVQALHNAGIGVIMDVVYNHTYSLNSNLNKVVPSYYYRFKDGVPSNGSGCGNETASNRYMFRKYMIESVTYWQEEYHIDGFRFDLMGLHDIETMQAIEQAVHANNPRALIYGEGWTGGSSTLAGDRQSILANIQALNANQQTNGVAMFNDVIRDAVKGAVGAIDDTGYATGSGKNATLKNKVLFGVAGSVKNSGLKATNPSGWYAYNPTNTVNYVSAHDNNTLWDRICAVYGEGASSLDLRLKYNALSAAIVQTSLGIPFMMAGEEMLRAKKNADGTYNENSYKAGDEVNKIRWNLLTEDSEQTQMMNYYKGLIAFRKTSTALRNPVVAAKATDSTGTFLTLLSNKDAVLAFTMTDVATGETLCIVYNAGTTAASVTLPAGSWDLFVNGVTAGDTAINSEALSGAQQIAGVSCYVFRKK